MNKQIDVMNSEEPGTVSFDNFAIRMTEDDNVGIAKSDIGKGTVLKLDKDFIEIKDDVPRGQRFLLENSGKGELLKQYGYPFGISRGVIKGQSLGANDLDTYTPDYNQTNIRHNVELVNTPAELFDMSEYEHRTFKGYVRENGNVGTRNYYLILPTSLCAGDMAVRLSNEFDNDSSIKEMYENIDGVVAAAHTEGCGCNDGNIIDRVMLTLKNTVMNANVGGVLVIDLGCEKTNQNVVSEYFSDLKQYGKPIDFISIQNLGGTGKTLSKGRDIIGKRLIEVNEIQRSEVPVSSLIVGTECGASDSFSGITANPLIGHTVDKIKCAGGSAILSEVPEMIGAEENLINRMSSEDVVSRFIKGMDFYKDMAQRLGISMNGNLVQGNKTGGLINLTLKSLGAVLKGGSGEIVDFVDYGERIRKKGLTIMNGPGNDIESMTGLVASGANMILFSTGMGTTEGNLIAPVIKIPTRTEIFNRMNEDMDFNAGRLLDENTTLDEMSDDLFELVIKVASGEKTCSEKWEKRSFQIWSAGKLSL